MLTPGKTPKELIEEVISKNRKKRAEKKEYSLNDVKLNELIDKICSIECRNEALIYAFSELKSHPDKTIEECLEWGLKEWDK